MASQMMRHRIPKFGQHLNDTQVEIVEFLSTFAQGTAIFLVVQTMRWHSQVGNFALYWITTIVLAEHALYHVAETILSHPEAKLLYSDEDKLYCDTVELAENWSKYRQDPYLKPDWDEELILTQNFFSHLGVYQTELMRSLGGFREEVEGAQDWDLVLRCSEQVSSREIIHIPKVLYHWRVALDSVSAGIDNKPYARTASLRVVTEALERRGVPAEVSVHPLDSGSVRVQYLLKERPSVRIVIPSKDNSRELEKCLKSISEHTSYANFKITVVDNQSSDSQTRALLHSIGSDPDIDVLEYQFPFNFSAMNNLAIKRSAEQFLLLLNDDTQVIETEWLEELVSHASRPGVGVVGAKLLYPDNTVQHAGVLLGVGGIANHAFCGIPGDAAGYQNRARLVQQYSAVTGACMCFSRKVWQKVGGFDEKNLPVAFNDVDFCLRVSESGLKILWTPYARLYHKESISLGALERRSPTQAAQFERESQYMWKRWGKRLQSDPWYHPRLNKVIGDFSLEKVEKNGFKPAISRN